MKGEEINENFQRKKAKLIKLKFCANEHKKFVQAPSAMPQHFAQPEIMVYENESLLNIDLL